MPRRVLTNFLNGRTGMSLLCRDGQSVAITSSAPACCCSFSASASNPSHNASTSAPTLPPSLRELQHTLRAPRSTVISAINQQLKSSGHVDASGESYNSSPPDSVLDDSLSRLLLTSNSLSPQNLDTLRLLGRYNAGLSALRGQTILARVLNVNPKRVLVDTGFMGISEVPRDDVTIAHVHTEDGQLPARHSTADIRPGDLLRLRVDSVYTPYGDMQLTAVKGDVAHQRRVVWAELRRAMEQQRPVSGRVLNECPGGFAVGVAGFVAVLPAALAATATSRLVGVRQEFLILDMDSARQRITLRDPKLQRLRR